MNTATPLPAMPGYYLDTVPGCRYPATLHLTGFYEDGTVRGVCNGVEQVYSPEQLAKRDLTPTDRVLPVVPFVGKVCKCDKRAVWQNNGQ